VGDGAQKELNRKAEARKRGGQEAGVAAFSEKSSVTERGLIIIRKGQQTCYFDRRIWRARREKKGNVRVFPRKKDT